MDTIEPKALQPHNRSTRWLTGVTWGAAAAIVITIVIYFVSQAVGELLVSIYPWLKHWDLTRANEWLESSVIAQFLLIATIEAITMLLLWLYLKRKKASFKTLGWSWPRPRDFGYALGGFVVYFPLVVLASALIKVLLPSVNLDQKQQLGFTSAHGGMLVLVFLSLVILPPLVEESLARGFLYLGLKKTFKFIPALIITSIIFALAHLQIGSGAPLLWTAAADTFILSVILVYLREKEGRLWPAIFLHMIKNGLAFYVLFLAPQFVHL